jgi:hypothetical protein
MCSYSFSREGFIQMWLCTPAIPPFIKLRQDNYKFEETLGYIVSSGQPGIHSETLSQTKQTNKERVLSIHLK